MNLFGSAEVGAHAGAGCLAVIPLLVGPLQVLLALLPAILIALGSALLALLRPSTFKLGLHLLWRMKLSLLLVAAVLFASVRFITWLWPKPRATTAVATPLTENYLLFRGGPQRLGFAPGSPEPLEGGVNWIFDRDNIAIYSTPTVVGKRVYFSTADRGFRFNRGAVYCVDADTGALIWKATPPGMRAAVSAPAVSGKYLIVGEGFHETQDANIFCLDITQRGKVLWRQRTRNHVETTACIANGRAYIGAGDDGYYCVELEPDANGQPRVVWHAPGSLYQDSESCPVVHEGKVFVGLGVDGNAVVCLDANTGRQIWRTPAPYPVFAPPTIYSNRVITATGNGDYGTTGQQWALRAAWQVRRRGGSPQEVLEAMRHNGPAGEVWCLDAATGEVAWKFAARDQIMGTIAADNGRLYVGSRDGFAYCLSMDGRLIARWNAREPILACPAVGPETAYFVTEPGRLIALDRQSFTPVWEVPLGSDRCMSSPTIANGRVYVGTPDTGLLCVGQPSSRARGQMWPGFLAGPGNPGGLGGWTPGEDGMLAWTQFSPDNDTALSAQVAPAAALNQRLFQPVARGPERGLICWRTDGGAESPLRTQWRLPVANGVHLSPAANAISVFVVDGTRADSARQLQCVEAATGRVQWRQPIGPGASGEFVLADEQLLIQDATNALTAFDASGRMRWRREIGTLAGSPAWQDSVVLAATIAPRGLLALDGPSGRTLWSAAIDPRTGPVVKRNTIHVGTSHGVAALRLMDGSKLWETATGEPVAPLSINDQWMASLDRFGQISVLNSSGTLVNRLPGAEPRIAPLLTRDALLFATRDSLQIHQFDTRVTFPWLETRMLGTLTAPPVINAGSLYFPTTTRGLVRAVTSP